MIESNPQQTLREFREYFIDSYEAQYKLAARIGIDFNTLAQVLADRVKPKARTIARLRVFLDAEARRAPPTATELNQLSRCHSKSSSPPSKSGTLGSVRSAGRRGARFAS
jgi:transcriptional regulator with XRE-family HTH domain